MTRRRTGAAGRLYRSELKLLFGRKRNLALLGGLACMPVIVGLAIAFTRNTAIGAHGPGFFDRVTENGLFLIMAALVSCLPLLLPLVTSIIAGDAIAGEAQSGTLRYLLTVPVPRTRLLAVKAAAVYTFTAAAVLAVALAGLIAGGVLFGWTDFTLISGDTVSFAAGLARTGAIVTYIALTFIGLATIGLFFSTLTEVPVAAMAATVVTSIASNILENLPQVAAIHPALFTNYWFTWGEWLHLHVQWPAIGQGLAVQAAWVAVFGALAWSRFTTADISS